MKEIKVRESGRLEISSDSSVHVEDGTDAVLLIEPKARLSLELRIGKGCHVDSYLVQESGSSVMKRNHIGEGSVLRSHCLWLAGGGGRVVSRLEGDRSEAHEIHVFVCRDSAHLHLDSSLQHIGKGTRGSILVRGIVKDRAEARLDGRIRVEREASGADSSLSENVMLLDPGARATATPELEILNDDVASSHSATVSRIDEKQVFYLTSRGMGREDAEKLIVKGFLGSCIERIADGRLREEFLEKALSAL